MWIDDAGAIAALEDEEKLKQRTVKSESKK